MNDQPDTTDLGVGSPVEVWNRFDHTWSAGFAVAAQTGRDLQLRRSCDGVVLPAWFTDDEVRPADRATAPRRRSPPATRSARRRARL